MCFDEKTSATSVTMYGNTLKMTVGTTLSAGIACDTFASVVKNPKKNVAPKIPSGFHCPKMSAAIDKKPRPATLPLNSPVRDEHNAAAEPRKRTACEHSEPAHPAHVDARAFYRRRVFAAGAQAQTERCAV